MLQSWKLKNNINELHSKQFKNIYIKYKNFVLNIYIFFIYTTLVIVFFIHNFKDEILPKVCKSFFCFYVHISDTNFHEI